MHKGKLFKHHHGSVLTVKDGCAMAHGFRVNGLTLGDCSEANQNTNELVKRWNSHDKLIDICERLSNELNAAIKEVNQHREKESKEAYPWDNKTCHVASVIMKKAKG